MTTVEQTDLAQQTDVDAAAVEEFASGLIGTITGGLITCLIDIGRRVGLFELAAAGPATSAELAERGGLRERYVREWLAAMATAGIVEYDADNGRFWLPVEHAAVLTGDTYDNLASVAYLASIVIRRGDAVAKCFTEGGGVPWAAYLPEMHDVMDVLWQPMYRDLLVQQILPLAPGLAPGLVEKLESGTRVADVACGSGNGTLVLARRFPSSTFVGYDMDAEAIEVARSRARGLSNVSFEVADAATLISAEPFGAAFVFNSVHDQARPLQVLSSIQSILEPGGTFLINEPRISSNLEDNIGNPAAAMTYAISLLHCMTVSLAEDGAGLGTGWGEQVAVGLLAVAGFGPVEVHDAPGDPGNAIFVTHRPERDIAGRVASDAHPGGHPAQATLSASIAHMRDATEPTTPTLRQVVLDCEDARALAEFYRQLLGFQYRPGDEPPADETPDTNGQEWLVLCDNTGTRRLAFQQVPHLPEPTWPEGPRPQMLHLDTTVPTVSDLQVQHQRALALGARLLRDRSDDELEPLFVYADPAGHPFCIFVAG